VQWEPLEENHALNCIITALAEKSKQVTIKAQQAHQGDAQASQNSVGVRYGSVYLTTGERNSLSQIVGINAHLFQLATLSASLKTELQANDVS
jgi:hypothetical protein